MHDEFLCLEAEVSSGHTAERIVGIGAKIAVEVGQQADEYGLSS